MITHNQWFKLQMFRAFWQLELEKHGSDRYIPRKHRYNIFDTHARNVKGIRSIMAKKKSSSKPEFDWQGYINISIPETKHEELEAYVADDKTVFFEYNALLVTDYQIKQYHDVYVDAIKTVATCYNAESSNFGYALTSYASDWYTSLAILVYKHLILAKRDWNSVKSNKIKKFG